jgi:acyl-CoA synthetase (AMP-forming)/AMP-acid ligase II
MRGRYSPNLVANWLLSCARHNPEGVAVVEGEERTSWSALARRALRLANALRGLGVAPGDKVALLHHNTRGFIEASYATQIAGAVPAPANYRFTAHELDHQLRHSDARVLLYDAEWREAVAPVAAELGLATVCWGSGPTATARCLRVDELCAAEAAADPAVATELDELAVIIYTGGTTGSPKGVMLSYRAFVEMFANLLASMVQRAGELELSAEQIAHLGEVFPLPGASSLVRLTRLAPVRRALAHALTHRAAAAALRHAFTHPEVARLGYGEGIGYLTPSLPFFHSASFQMLMLGLFCGRLRFLLTRGASLEPEVVLATIERERPAFVANAPTGWRKLLAHPGLERFDLRSVRVAATGTAHCPLELKERVFAAFPGVIFLDLFGQTELAPLTSFRIDTHPRTLRRGSVGRTMVETRIIDEQGRVLPAGETGEVCYRSPTLMRGYYKDEERTREVIDGEGWFRSGDLGRLDADGELHIVERKSECINTGGEKVFPLEVEEVLLALPQVEDACVYGVPDERWGSAVAAAVRLRPGATATAEELIAGCRARLAGYKLPKSIVFVDELPRSPVGKLRRGAISSAP